MQAGRGCDFFDSYLQSEVGVMEIVVLAYGWVWVWLVLRIL